MATYIEGFELTYSQTEFTREWSYNNLLDWQAILDALLFSNAKHTMLQSAYCAIFRQVLTERKTTEMMAANDAFIAAYF